MAGLDVVDAWRDRSLVDELVRKRYRWLGLNVSFEADLTAFDWTSLRVAHPTFEKYVQHWHGDKPGQAFNARSGSGARFKRYMLDNGFDVDVPHSKHWRLAHGLHDLLDPDKAEKIPHDRRFLELFDRWWERDPEDGSSS